MKFSKKILVVLCNLILLNVANQCFASTNENVVYSKDGINYIDKVYSVEQAEEKDFIKNIEQEITIDNIKYIYADTKIENQDTIESREINTTKTCVINTNNREKIIETLGESIEYNEDGFIGTYILDENTINIKTHNNGYYDRLIDKTVEYTELPKNDLDYVPKQITYEGKTLDLLSTKWDETATKKIGDATVGAEYKAICYYATKERIYRPNTYTITAKYTGVAEKNVLKPLKITISYKEVKKTEEPQELKEKDNDVIPVLGGTSGIIIFLGALFLFMKNVKIYNYQNGKWVYVGKALVLKGKIKLDRFSGSKIYVSNSKSFFSIPVLTSNSSRFVFVAETYCFIPSSLTAYWLPFFIYSIFATSEFSCASLTFSYLYDCNLSICPVISNSALFNVLSESLLLSV